MMFRLEDHWTRANPMRALIHYSALAPLLFLLAHIPLAIVLRQYRSLATIHGLITVAVAMWWTVTEPSGARPAYAIAYLTGAEVLWRMTKASLPWEVSKYVVALVAIMALVLSRRWRSGGMPMAYFALLLPSVLLTVGAMGLADARNSLTFNLAGPIVLMLSVWFFSSRTFTPDERAKVWWCLLAPVVGVALLAFRGTLVATPSDFATESNSLTSGGFGPNQVSAMLGAGALIASLLVTNSRQPPWIRLFLMFLSIGLVAQAVMTFSRGGVLAAGAAMGLVWGWGVGSFRARVRIVVTVLLVALAAYLLLPIMNQYTGGKLGARYAEVNVTHRDEIARADLELWWQHPLFGVGPGQAIFHRPWVLGPVAAHTEFTRLLSEHGLFGGVSLGLLVVMALMAAKRQRHRTGRAMALGLVTWTFLTMLHAAMRVAAAGTIFGMAFLQTDAEDPSE